MSTNEVTKRAETQYTPVKMDDGTVVDFPGSRKLIKSTTISEDGTVTLRLYFLNGEVRSLNFRPDSALYANFAAHGIAQKYGDTIAGLSDIEDGILAIDALHERIQAGEWGSERSNGNELAGTSVLCRAMMEVSKKSKTETADYLKKLSQAEKMAIRNNPLLAPVVQRLEAEKLAKKKPKAGLDTAALLSDFLGQE